MNSKRIPHIPIDKRDPATVRAVVLARMSDPGAKEVSMESQVEACQRFIAKMGWPKSTLGPFTDKASGYLHVERPALDEVERLIARREVDVVVVLNFERLARNLERRYASLFHARKYGVEYRFAEIEPDGKLPDTLESRLIAPVLEAYGELNRQKIVENTARGKAKRVAMGLPSGGRGGPPYGFRKAREGDETTYWAEREDEAEVLREMFTWIAEMDATRSANASARSLCRDLNRRGIRTRAGKKWSAQTVIEKLRNPLYCGRGRLNRWQIVHEDKTDETTNETYDTRVVKTRADAETFSIAEGMLPKLVDSDLFAKVQAILDAPNLSAGRLARKNSTHPHDATLLHSGFLKCAYPGCGRSMVRYWRPPSPKHPQGVAYYRCGTMGGSPDHCVRHSIRAETAEDFVLRALARVLSDPEKIIALADAAEKRLEEAQYVVLKATTDMEAMEALIAETDAEIANTLDAIAALAKVSGMEDTIAGLRAKVVDLSAGRDRAEAERARLTPRRDRATQRQAFLRSLFTERDKLMIGSWLPMEHAEALLNVPHETPDGAKSTVIDLDEKSWLDEPAADNWPEVPYRHHYANSERDAYSHDEANREFVVYLLLRRTPYNTLRKLLRELDVVELVGPPRTPAERAAKGKTPPAERITVQIGDLVIHGQALIAADVAGSPDVTNVTKLAMPTISTPAAHRSG